ncbi:hypothetical protein E2562_008215 [Oryza meyeriana var. granulata]|uniref:RING-type domain-containing protein n=1 Tax=Oryza meyeriana var. granulata TaxID=110450 RepID=A0A6G1DFX4_9ORYZ|nr:hypothetical protein E2562_008215 [Oryza meyeriana var. granulata]
MAALAANPVPDVGHIGRIWTRIAADTAAVSAATGEGSHSTPAVSAGKGEGQHSAPAVSASEGGGDHSAPAVPAGMEEEHHNVQDDPMSAKGQALLADRDTPAVFAGMEEEVHHNVQNDPVSSKRQALLADQDTPAVFAGMEEGHDNAWYDSVIREAMMSELQDDTELHEPSPVQYLAPRPRSSETPDDVVAPAAAGEEEAGEFSMPSFFKKWGLRPSDLDPDEAGPSTRRPRVLPLGDDDLPTFDCGICFDTFSLLDLFRGLQCDHKYCLECMTTYVEGKVREGAVPVPCPEPACKEDEEVGVLHPEGCKKAIDFGAFSDWGLRLAEGAVPHNRRAYRPNRRCGILLETSGEEKPAMAVCPACKLLLCATCGQEWSTKDDVEHRDCTKDPEAAMMKQLAEERRWNRGSSAPSA